MPTKPKKSRLLDADATRAVLDRFLAKNIDPDEWEKAEKRLDPACARAYLIERIVEGAFGPGDRFTLPFLFQRLGLGDQTERLISLVRDSSASISTRTAAFNILLTADESGVELVLSSLSDDEHAAILRQSLADQIVNALCEPSCRGVIAELAGQDGDEAIDAASRVGELRRSLSVPATPLYSALVQSPSTSDVLRRQLLQQIADDGSLGALELLEALEKKRGWKDRVRGPLMRARTRVAERRSVPGRAYLSAWDNGVWFASVEFDAGDVRVSASLLIEDGSLTHGFASAGSDSMSAEALGQVVLSEVTPETAYAFVEQKIRDADPRTANEARAAIDIFQRVSHSDAVELPLPLSSLSGHDIEGLLGRREYENWMFSPEQLIEAGITPPDQIPASARWKEAAIAKLSASTAGQQFSSAAQYMARWHTTRGETREAAIAAKLALDLLHKFELSAVVRRLLERSVEHLLDRAGEEPGGGDPPDVNGLFGVVDRIHESLLPVVDQQRRSRGGVPKVKATFDRLRAEGFPKDRARELIAFALQGEMTFVLEHQVPHDPERYGRLLDMLPDLEAVFDVLEELDDSSPPADSPRRGRPKR